MATLRFLGFHNARTTLVTHHKQTAPKKRTTIARRADTVGVRRSATKQRQSEARPTIAAATRALDVAEHDAACFSAGERKRLRGRLLDWFASHRRDLPWRRTRDAYYVWLSEIMLQQTQVATVVPYFNRFVAAFPTIKALAAADECEVLRLWEGLGYYRRARQLHRAARTIVSEFHGAFPRTPAEALSLPGVGRYTAGAVLSIAFDQPAPILEANTIRLLSRLIGASGDVSTSTGQRRLWSVAGELVAGESPGDLNQALMELGSLVCAPRDPKCEECPVAKWCVARRDGRQHEIPRLRGKPIATFVNEAAVIVWKDGKVLLRHAQLGQRWAGLWDFPRFQLDSDLAPSGAAAPRRRKPGAASADLIATTNGDVPPRMQTEIVAQAESITGTRIGPMRLLSTMRHSVTRFRITLHCFEAVAATAPRQRSDHRRRHGEMRWFEPGELPSLPMNTTGRKLARLVQRLAADRESRRRMPC